MGPEEPPSSATLSVAPSDLSQVCTSDLPVGYYDVESYTEPTSRRGTPALLATSGFEVQ